jgi:hypothetical protein
MLVLYIHTSHCSTMLKVYVGFMRCILHLEVSSLKINHVLQGFACNVVCKESSFKPNVWQKHYTCPLKQLEP